MGGARSPQEEELIDRWVTTTSSHEGEEDMNN